LASQPACLPALNRLNIDLTRLICPLLLLFVEVDFLASLLFLDIYGLIRFSTGKE
jgi:hypothetical protein